MSGVIVADLDIFMGLWVVLVLVLIFFAVSIFDFFKASLKTSFKILLLVFMAAACVFVAIFGVGLWWVLENTSFVNHIYDGDLIEHLRRGTGL